MKDESFISLILNAAKVANGSKYERFSIFYTQDFCLWHKLGMCLTKTSHRNAMHSYIEII